MLGRALTSTLWGMIADRIGRKPVIVVGIFTGLVFNTLFGLSVHYWMAIATRFLLGSFNGLLGPIRVSTAWAMGLIIGPAIGGYLAQPTEKYPKLFPANSLFERFPYLLTSLCISAFYFIILLSCIWLPIFPMWAESDRRLGGLSLSSENVGQVLAITGATILFYQTFVYPYVVKLLGPINTSRFMIILSMALLITYPSIAHLNEPWLSIALNIASMIKANSVVTVVTCSFILQNNSVSQDQRATTNGLATTLMSFSKAIAPAGAGIVFSWAQKHQHVFFFQGGQMVFLLLDIVVLIELIWTFKPFLAMPEQFSLS
ncbi:Protein ZINC INDUCED FACILITATOR-LIKE 1 [Dichanthelium oligosanthes]|uniref:Protein ZINC INDUCED FACILITATOR-LIKE 1 n=1 Tax=Dichanthelium oligosanthes TaxID=888268 RepID=A0A1E5UPR6_9POAL|nr:Protein ZINC INDUCED FACILITATOR-LIKE 1 [Dichanthelium oligosanthes]